MVHADACVFIVTGSTIEAELSDRPVAYALRELVEHALARAAQGQEPTPTVVVCGDVWYLNQHDCRLRPTISVGPPRNNALTAYLGDRVESVLAVQGQFVVQMDPGLDDLTAVCWGSTSGGTTAAAQAFAERYLEGWAAELLRREPSAGSDQDESGASDLSDLPPV